MPDFDPLIRAPSAPSLDSVLNAAQMFGNLPNVFRQAQLNQAQVDAMNALKAMPLTQDGQINYGGIAQALAKAGDVRDLWQVLPLVQSQQANLGAQAALRGDVTPFGGAAAPPSDTAPAPAPAAATPAPGVALGAAKSTYDTTGIAGSGTRDDPYRVNTTEYDQIPPNSYWMPKGQRSGEPKLKGSVRALVQAPATPAPAPGTFAARFGQETRDLDQMQRELVQRLDARDAAQAAPRSVSAPVPGGIAPAQAQPAAPVAAPVVAPAGPPSAPPPGPPQVAVPPQIVSAPAPPTAPAAAPSPYDRQLRELVPARFPGTVRQYRDFLALAADQQGITPQAQRPLLERIQKIDDVLARKAEAEIRAQEPTAAQKEARESGFRSVPEMKRAEEVQKVEVKQMADFDRGIQGMANSSATILPSIQLQKSLTNNPDFYSGTGEQAALYLKRTIPSLAGSAAPMELYQKVLASNMLHQIDTMKASAAEMGATQSRIFSAQIGQIEKASGQLDNSVTGLRGLAELSERSAKRNIQIADFANAYKSGDRSLLPKEFTTKWPPPHPGELDSNFEKGMRDWMGKNPMLTEAEERDPRVLGARTFATPADAVRAGLRKGEPIRLPNGEIRYAP